MINNEIGTVAEKAQSKRASPKEYMQSFSRYMQFLLIGMVSVNAWNSVMVMTSPICKSVLHVHELSDYLLGIFCAGTLLVQLLYIYTGTLRMLPIIIGGLLSCACSISFIFCIRYIEDSHTAVIVIHIICFIMGLSAGSLQASGFRIAGWMPENYVPYVSGGQGTSGLLMGLLPMCLSFGVYDFGTREGVLSAVNILFGLTAVISLLQCAFATYFTLVEWPVYLKAAENTTNSISRCETPSDLEACKANPTRRSCFAILLDSAEGLACVFFCLFLSLLIFPNIGPLQWNINGGSMNDKVLLIAVFNCADFVGRFSPAVLSSSKLLKHLIIPRKYLIYFVLARAVFLVPFFLGAKMADCTIINDLWFLGIVLFTMQFLTGYVTTLSLMYAPDYVPNSEEKDLVCTAAVIMLVISIMVALYLSLAF